jgi:hypothetical protein
VLGTSSGVASIRQLSDTSFIASGHYCKNIETINGTSFTASGFVDFSLLAGSCSSIFLRLGSVG